MINLKTLEEEERTHNVFLLQMNSRNRFQLLSRDKLHWEDPEGSGGGGGGRGDRDGEHM